MVITCGRVQIVDYHVVALSVRIESVTPDALQPPREALTQRVEGSFPVHEAAASRRRNSGGGGGGSLCRSKVRRSRADDRLQLTRHRDVLLFRAHATTNS